MANWTKQDVYEVMNELVAQTMGMDSNLKVFDSTSFVAVGEKLQSYGKENILNALTMMITKTIFSSRPYDAKFKVLREENRLWGNAIRKITHLYNEAIPTMDNNTNLNSPLGKGKTVNPFEQIPSYCVETAFIGTNEISKGLTTYTRTQFNVAFQSEDDFAMFIVSEGVQWRNEISKIEETERRATVLNYIGACISCGMGIDVVEAFNIEYGTSYTQAELFGEQARAFYEYLSYFIDNLSSYFEELSIKNHVSIGGFDRILRHTPKSEQRLILFAPFFRRMKRLVLANAFNPEMLGFGEYEEVNYWQNENQPSKISVKPAYIDTNGNQVQNVEEVNLDYVLGVLYDVEAMGWYKIDEATDTVWNGRGKYWSVWYSAQSKPWNDMTENGCVLYCGPGGAPTSNVTVSPCAQNRKLFNVNVSDLQENDIVISNGAITGTLKKLTGSNPITDNWGEGYFIALKFDGFDNVTSCKVGLNPSEGSGLVEIINDPDKDGVFKITNKNQQDFEVRSIISGKIIDTNFDLSGLTLS